MYFLEEDNLQQPPGTAGQPVKVPDGPPAEPPHGPAALPAPDQQVAEQPQAPRENSWGFTPEEQAIWDQTKDYNAAWQIKIRRKDREEEEQRRQRWSASEPGRLLRQLGEAYAAYKSCLERSPHAAAGAQKYDELNQRIFERMRTTVEKANNAPRCARIMAGGRRCRAPRVRGKQFCHMHLAMEETRPQKLNLPSLDDANSIQLAIAKAAQALVDGQLDDKYAGKLGYYLQLAASNVGRLDFEEEEEDEDGADENRRDRP